MTQPVSLATASELLDHVLSLHAKLAVFDCDGTLWSGDAGRDFFYWEIDRGLVDSEIAGPMLERYRLYEEGQVDELSMCGEMVTMHDGLPVAALRQAAEEFFAEMVESRIFPEMRELTHKLAEQGCEIWAVSSTNDWVVEAGVQRFGIPRERVLAACVHVIDGRATGRLIRVPTDELKVTAIHDVIRRPVQAVFGNSVHDQAMLEIAARPFCINPNPNLEAVAKARHWPIYWPNAIPRTL